MKKEEAMEKCAGFCTDTCNTQLETNDKNVGSSAPLEKDQVFTIIEGDFIPSVTTYESKDKAVAANVDLNNRNVTVTPVMENGVQIGEKVTVDNSYYAVRVEGSRQNISLRMLTSWTYFSKDEIPEGAICIPGGKATEVFARAAEYKGQSIKVFKTKEWKKGATVNKRAQNYDGSAAIFVKAQSARNEG